jgi:hypothetical protein
MLVLVFLIVRALLRWVVRLVHAEWSRCQGPYRDPVVHGSVAPDGRERGSQQNRAGIPWLEPCCDQEVSKRTLATLHKVYEEVSNKEIRNHFEPRDVRVSLPRRADE